MLFDLWVLCLIATGLGMFIVSVIGNALSRLREHMQERHTHIDSPRAPIGWGH
jgi:HAMP domain-containing protein